MSGLGVEDNGKGVHGGQISWRVPHSERKTLPHQMMASPMFPWCHQSRSPTGTKQPCSCPIIHNGVELFLTSSPSCSPSPAMQYCLISIKTRAMFSFYRVGQCNSYTEKVIIRWWWWWWAHLHHAYDGGLSGSSKSCHDLETMPNGDKCR